MHYNPLKPLIIYDGACGLCNKTVQIILRANKGARFQFAALDSNSAKMLENNMQTSFVQYKSVVLIHQNKIFTQSHAVIKIGLLLGFPFSASVILYLIPPFIRNFVYNIIAKNRLRFFAPPAQCTLHTKKTISQFLQ
jgi:predicted DCC family thiol-disulfide oxidoreductase YuxK